MAWQAGNQRLQFKSRELNPCAVGRERKPGSGEPQAFSRTLSLRRRQQFPVAKHKTSSFRPDLEETVWAALGFFESDQVCAQNIGEVGTVGRDPCVVSCCKSSSDLVRQLEQIRGNDHEF